MEYRKLISFGNSSYVMSIPKDWLEKHGLAKGDTVYLDIDKGNITIYPSEANKKKPDKEITIDAEGKSLEVLNRKIIASYINNVDVIRIKGTDLGPKIKHIKRIVNSLVAMEPVEQTTKSITLRSFLNIREVDIKNTVRKADHIVRSMFLDLEKMIESNAFEATEISDSINNRDEDVNRMCFLMFRAINFHLNTGKINTDLDEDILQVWGFSYFLEEIADEIKRISRVLKTIIDRGNLSEYNNIISMARENYTKCMKAFYTKDNDLVYEVADQRKIMLEKCDDLLSKSMNKPTMISLMDKTKALVAKIHNINRMSY